jgi:uncharacterized protein
VLTMSGLALLDKSGWAPLGAGEDQTHPVLIALTGVAMILVMPLIWGLLRQGQGLPMFGAPTVAELDGPGPAAAHEPSPVTTTDSPRVP